MPAWVTPRIGSRKQLMQPRTLLQQFITRGCTPHRRISVVLAAKARQPEVETLLDDNDAHFMQWAETAGVSTLKLQPAEFKGLQPLSQI